MIMNEKMYKKITSLNKQGLEQKEIVKLLIRLSSSPEEAAERVIQFLTPEDKNAKV